MFKGGGVPSGKIKSLCLIPFEVKPAASYVWLLRRMTNVTPSFLKTGT
jgi:hypothetical protein